jgi:hypothetical protein
MMKIDKHNVKYWVEKFLNGETSNAEEQALYDFFASGDVPRSMKKYRAMFQWYEGGMKEPLPQPARRFQMRRLVVRLSIAASILLACGIGIAIYQYQQEQELYECYEGSYIIRNGEKITDIKKILPELRKTTQLAVEQEKKITVESNKDADDYLKEINSGKAEAKADKDNLPVI